MVEYNNVFTLEKPKQPKDIVALLHSDFPNIVPAAQFLEVFLKDCIIEKQCNSVPI